MTMPPSDPRRVYDMSADETALESLRREIDEIDDSLHRLIMRRAEITTEIGRAKAADGGGTIRPAREAAILRRLLDGHAGPFPKAALVRIWREMLGASAGLQQTYSVAYYMPDPDPGYRILARGHFGVVTPTAGYRSPGEVVSAVSEGKAAVGVLPVPVLGEPAPWWRNIVGGETGGLRVFARLPFAGAGASTDSELEAIAIGGPVHAATGRDRTWLVIETGEQVSRGSLASALGEAGLTPTFIDAREERGDLWWTLVEVDGFVAPGDGRIDGLAEVGAVAVARVYFLGGYAVPLDSASLADDG